MAKRKKTSAAKSETAAKSAAGIVEADPMEDDAPLMNIPIPSAVSTIPAAAAAAPAAPTQPQLEARDLPESEKLKAQNYAAEQQLLAVKEHNLSLRKQVLQLQQQVLELQSKEFSQAKQESENERQEWLNSLGALGMRDGKLIVPKNGSA